MSALVRADLEAIDSSPGRFEGERVILQVAYAQWMDGFASDDGDVIAAEVPVAWRGTDQIPAEWETIRFRVDDQGFVREVRP